MKKAIFVLLLSFILILASCQKDDTDVPLNILVTDGIFTCDTYEDATAYEINLTSNQVDVTYEVQNDYDLNYLVSNGTYQFKVRAVLGEDQYSDYSSQIEVTIENSLKKSVLTGTSLHDEAYMEINGRTLYDEAKESQMLYYTASGFEIEFYGTSLDLVITSDNALNASRQAYISVVIDDAGAPYEGTTYVLTQTEMLLYVAEDLDEGFHKVAFYKINESLDNNIGIKRVRTDGFFTKPEIDEEQLKIQYIGASTTTGYGNLGSLSDSKTSENSNGLLAFTSLSAYIMGAKWSLTSASGWGISKGWNTGGAVNETLNIPNAFDYVAINSQGQVIDTLWDQTAYQPDIYVVNLGSNDYNTSNYANLSATEQDAFDELFVNNYKAFLLKLHSYSPDALIIVTYGILSKLDVVEDLTLEAVDQAKLQYAEIYTLELKTGTELGFQYGSNYHPNLFTHERGAHDLATFMSQITGIAKVHPNISIPMF